MPAIETFITFLFALTLLEISPGPDMMLTIARGVGQGRRIALLTVVGNVFVAGFVQVSFLVLGLVTVVHAWPVALDLLRWVGAAYLMWLGIKMIATSGTDTRLRKTAKISDWNAVKEGALNSLKDTVKDMQPETMTETDVANVKSATEALTQEFYKISEKLYQQAQAAQGGDAANGGDSNVVDGEGKEL